MEVTQFELSRQFWDFAFENPDLIKPTHAALYFYAIDKCNRLGWKEKFGLPTDMAMESTGIRRYETYKKYLQNLVDWGFFKMVESSKNQYNCNIIAILNNSKARSKAHSKAIVNHIGKHCESIPQSTVQSNRTIDKHINQEPINQEPINLSDSYESGATKKNRVESSKKNKGGKTLFWAALVDTWFKFYESKKGETPTFTGAAPKDLKAIVENLQKRSVDRGEQWTEEIAVATLTRFLTFAYSLPWLCDNFLLSNLNRQFDKIITTKNGQQQTSNYGQPATGANVNVRSAFDAIDRYFGEDGGR